MPLICRRARLCIYITVAGYGKYRRARPTIAVFISARSHSERTAISESERCHDHPRFWPSTIMRHRPPEPWSADGYSPCSCRCMLALVRTYGLEYEPKRNSSVFNPWYLINTNSTPNAIKIHIFANCTHQKMSDRRASRISYQFVMDQSYRNALYPVVLYFMNADIQDCVVAS